MIVFLDSSKRTFKKASSSVEWSISYGLGESDYKSNVYMLSQVHIHVRYWHPQ